MADCTRARAVEDGLMTLSEFEEAESQQ